MSFNLIIDWQEYTTYFRNHQITMELRPLKSYASVLLVPIFVKSAQTTKSKKNKADDYTADDLNLTYEVQDIAIKILPEHLRNLEGICVNDAAVTTQMLCEETIFAPLVMDIISELVARSQIGDADVKN
jgi:hypothetical protein